MSVGWEGCGTCKTGFCSLQGEKAASCSGQPHAWEATACKVWRNRQHLWGLCLLALPCCTLDGLFPTPVGFRGSL